MLVHIIAAVSNNGVIGADGDIPWNIPEDMKHFQKLTSGHAIIMGRKTWDSIGRALPKRVNIVMSRQSKLELPDGVVLVDELSKALDECRERECEKAFVIGGEAIYSLALSVADVMNLTYVDLDVDGDARFPDWDTAEWAIDAEEKHDGFSYVDYVKR